MSDLLPGEGATETQTADMIRRLADLIEEGEALAIVVGQTELGKISIATRGDAAHLIPMYMGLKKYMNDTYGPIDT